MCAKIAQQSILQGCRAEHRLVCHHQDKQLHRTNVLFDRYDTIIKNATMCQRACEASREYKLTMNAPLPKQPVVRSVTKKNVQQIDLICEELQKRDDEPLNTSLVITGIYHVPVEVRSKGLVQRIDLKTTKELADVIMNSTASGGSCYREDKCC